MKVSKSLEERKNKVLISIIVIFCVLHLFLANFPKHSDFHIMSYTAKRFAEGHYDFIDYILNVEKKNKAFVAYPPLFYIIEGTWLKFLSSIQIIDLNKIDLDNAPLPFGLFPHIFSFILAVYLTYRNVKNKFLTLIWFGTPSLISIQVMGQIDVFSSLFLLISIILALRASLLNDEKFWILSFAFLGLSMCFKPYTAMLIPLYILFLFSKATQYSRALFLTVFCIFSLILIFLIPWIPYWEHFDKIVLGESVIASESAWILKLLIISPIKQQFEISVWLFGYLILIYYSLKNHYNLNRSDNLFIFLIFAIVSWFFAASYTHPQWHIILLPPLILLIDKVWDPTDKIWNLKMVLFIVAHQMIFLFYSMKFSTRYVLRSPFMFPTVPITGDLSTIVCTLLSFVLVFWCIEIWNKLKINLK